MNELINNFHFLRPWWLLALIPTLILAVGLWRNHSIAQQWQKFISPQLLPFLLDKAQISKKRWPILGVLALWVLSVIAIAGPVWQKVPIPVQRNTSAVVICWDLSPSMLAEDFKPSRLMKSRLKIIDLLKAKKDGQVGLIAYSAEAYVVTPLTDDFQTIINLLPALGPTTLPSVGSNPEMAVEQAQTLLKDAGILSGNILLITDEVTPDALDNMENILHKSPHQLTFWTVGTEEGAPIPLPQGGFAKSSTGDIVVAKLNQKDLQQFSRKTGAYLVPLINGESDIKTINQLTSPISDQSKLSDRKIEQWFEHGQFLAVLLLPFCLLFFRKGIFFSLILIAPLFISQPSEAFSWQDLWKTQDQQAEEALQNGEDGAATRFSTPQKRGSALYKQDQYAEAAEQFAQVDDWQADYNRGTSLIHAGDYEGAISALEAALQKKPTFTDAQKNLAIAEQLKDLAEQNKQQSQDSNSSQDGDSENQDESQQSSDGQKDSDQQSQDGEQQDSSSGQDQQNQNSSAGESGENQQGGEQSSSAASEANPFATDEQSSSVASEASEQAELAEQTSSESGENSSQAAAAMAVPDPNQKALTEEEQMLEQWLRKVPDDPTGLMRNKFRHQYLQRRDSMNKQLSPGQESAEDRW